MSNIELAKAHGAIQQYEALAFQSTAELDAFVAAVRADKRAKVQAPTPPAAMVPLSDERIHSLLKELQRDPNVFVNPVTFTRAIEAEHRIGTQGAQEGNKE